MKPFGPCPTFRGGATGGSHALLQRGTLVCTVRSKSVLMALDLLANGQGRPCALGCTILRSVWWLPKCFENASFFFFDNDIPDLALKPCEITPTDGKDNALDRPANPHVADTTIPSSMRVPGDM